ncbi:UDP-N-acetylglucosamine 1-carboxyvinyltransferase [uncultured Psychroserpens sp.]|uniref:UDP-N-acetylglucosamine 1-carboxyvinyltransferase n=1 Tax=uncultured Psychroserpens sp. TaxID=255436 RepID=UPI00260DC5C2|nr:UDP-N-acetylglucosamine 1-carboxyvinyltransferase [uncultured Psychroserpens sp.]
MSTFIIEGGHQLKGNIQPQGAKNEALQILCAVLLTDQEITIHNIPDIIDVNKLIALLKKLGVKVNKIGKGSYTFKADEVNLKYLESEAFKEDGKGLRGSIMIVGPLLGRFGRGYIPKPGGDKIGRRRLDTHFEGFINLGAKFRYNKEDHFYGVEADKLKGTYMLLDEASVTGTANIVMAAVLAEGTTTIYNAACEPYLQQLCKMLNRMGAKIKGIGSNMLIIEGVDTLGGTEHRMLPDMIEIGSWIGLAAMTKSELTITNVSWDDLGLIPNVFRKIGITVERQGDDIHIPAHKDGYEVQSYIDGSILTVSDAPWPGFTPDLLSIILVVLTQARGSALVHQKMFESRLFFVDKLIDMGAKIILCDPHRATVIGHDFKSQLKATTMTSPDIRAGVSLLIAALSAKGTSTIHNIEQIDRGYENIDERLRAIGAHIERVEGN